MRANCCWLLPVESLHSLIFSRWFSVFSCHLSDLRHKKDYNYFPLAFACVQLILRCVRIWLPLYSRKLQSPHLPHYVLFSAVGRLGADLTLCIY